MARDIVSVGVVGLGTMGAGIVEVLARTGLPVVGVDVDEAGVARGREALEHSTGRAVARGKLTEPEATALHGRITYATSLEAVAGCGLVVEAVPEHLDLKKEIFTALDRSVGPDALLATNTSSLAVTEIAVATANPRRVVGLHFFNPAPVVSFVEVIRTMVTD
jgi:3-hydroxybutyryl-CoA dehydrogenase